MIQSRPIALHLRCKGFSGGAGIIALLVGMLVLIGWVRHVELLKRLLPGFKAMNPVTAFGIALTGLALLLRSRSPVGATQVRAIGTTIGKTLATLVFAIGLIELATNAFGLFAQSLRFGPEANQMAPNTALDLSLLGSSLLALDVTTRSNYRPAEIAAMAAAMISVLALFGYVYRVDALYAVPGFAPMALHTAFVSLVLAIGVLCARPEVGFMSLATSNEMGGMLIRRLLPTVALLFVLGWLLLGGERNGLYGREMGVALHTLVNILIFGVLVWWSARALHHVEVEREDAEARRDQAFALNRMIMDNSLDVICVLDRERRFVEVSAASAKLWGYAPTELIGRFTREFVHPDDLDRSAEAASLLMSDRPLVGFANRYLRKDGGVVSVDWTATWSEPDGLMFCVARDATQRIQYEKQLRESEERFRMMVANVRDYAILMLDADGRIATWNAGAEQLKGYKAEEIIGKHFSIFYPKEDLERGKPEMELKVAGSEGRCEDEGWRVRKDGSQFFADVVITALRDESGELRGFSKVTRDITERKEAEKELESFTYSVSHDLRAPLRHIDGYARILQEDAVGQLDDDMRRYLDLISASARKMGTLIDELLSFSRLGRKPIDRTVVDMNVLTGRALHEISGGRPNDSRVQVAALPPACGDPALLQQVWVNLLSNALKYSAKRGDGAEVEVTGERDGDIARYRIRDNGVGFDMRYVDKLFGIFQRLHSQEDFEGTGVGLAIVQRIVTRHGGRVWAEGECDRGATFTFELPADSAQSMEEIA